MRKITVADILKLDVLKTHYLAAGENGLSKEIHYVSVYDNMSSDMDSVIQVFEGDVYLSFCYYGQDDEQYVVDLVKMMIRIGASALIIFNEYIYSLPLSAAELCNEAALPVIFIDCQVPYSLVISSIMECKLSADQKKNIEDKLAAIVSSKTSQEEKEELIQDINPGFQKNVTALFALEKDVLTNMPAEDTESVNLVNAVNRSLLDFAAAYRDGILIVLSYSDMRLADLTQFTEENIDLIRKYIPRAQIGISNSCSLTDLGSAISQSYMAVSTGAADFNGVAFYDKLGITRLLLDLQGSSSMEDFYRDIMEPIQKADIESHACLRDTMLCFAANEMDYKKTCQAMFVHENTIRYRINRIKDLIPYGRSEIDFYETISVISKIYKMKNF